MDDPESLAALAERALESGEEIAVVERLSSYLRRNRRDATILHWLAMLLRSLDRREEAIAVLQEARSHAAADAGLLHALAHVTLEAGRPASRLFEQAASLAPAKAELRLGLAAARFAEGEGRRGLAELSAMLSANPGWIEGHRQYAQLAALVGEPERAFVTIDEALARFPGSERLHKLAVGLLIDGERYDAVVEAAERAVAGCGPLPAFEVSRAAALDELGDSEKARAGFDGIGAPQDAGHAAWLARHLLGCRDFAAASAIVEPWLTSGSAAAVWPYASLAWQASGDPRSAWLDRQGALVRVVDLDPAEIGLPALLPLLRKLHGGAGRFLDQSVRGGTQTDGPLLSRIEPQITAVREVLRREVTNYLAELPPGDPRHPTLSQRRDRRVRFAGSWSVRLQDRGFHAAHHHPQGWISSALYVAVPRGLAHQDGHLELGGSPASLGLAVPPDRSVPPMPGRLVLFPSWMWHGTRSFASGERVTIAFDIARPGS